MPIDKYIINRELSWLSFNERVLQEAQDKSVPLIERIRFLGIFSNNLDEFFKVRVATIKRMIDVEESTGTKYRENPKKVLAEIQRIVIRLQAKFNKTYNKIIRELAEHNIFLINENQLNTEQKEFVVQYFRDKILPVLSPVMLHNVEQFPDLKDKSIYLATRLSSSEPGIDTEYALIEIPTDILPRFITLPAPRNKEFIIILDDIIRYNLNEVFSILHFDKFEAFIIKLTRDAELDIDNDLSKSFLEKISKSVTERKKGQPVRFVYDRNISEDMLEYLTTSLELDEEDNLIPGGRYHNFKDYMKFPDLGKKRLIYKPTPPAFHPDFIPAQSTFDVIRNKDLLMHFPYQKFSHYISLLREAAIDPRVSSIRTTLYRVAQNSRVINALRTAAKNGKRVEVVIELQARFDEQSNIYWSKQLEEDGAIVHFGLPGLKVHSKLTLIKRNEGNKTVSYATVGTGNFHEGTAELYSDFMLLTTDVRITSEVEKVFRFIMNPYKNYKFSHLLVSPIHLRRRLYTMIDNEIKNAQAGKEAFIHAKLNSLVDREVIKKLYQANREGVKMTLNVRGICSIIPGIKGHSDNIDAFSIVDKYLEHSRVYVFCNGGDEKFYISSADWMTRNLDHRVEVASPIYDPKLQQEIRDFLDIQLKDNVKARILNKEQNNPYRKTSTRKKFRSQIELYQYYNKKYEENHQSAQDQ